MGPMGIVTIVNITYYSSSCLITLLLSINRIIAIFSTTPTTKYSPEVATRGVNSSCRVRSWDSRSLILGLLQFCMMTNMAVKLYRDIRNTHFGYDFLHRFVVGGVGVKEYNKD